MELREYVNLFEPTPFDHAYSPIGRLISFLVEISVIHLHQLLMPLNNVEAGISALQPMTASLIEAERQK